MTSVSDLIETLRGIRIPALPKDISIVDGSGRPSPQMIRWWQNMTASVSAITDTLAAIEEAQDEALDSINAARTRSANLSAMQRTGDSAASGLTISTGANSITISDHSREYREPALTVSVTGATITGLAAATTYYVFYEDSEREGGAVGYQTTTTIADANPSEEAPYRHFVGKATTGGAAGTPIGPPSWKRGLT